VQPDQHAYHNDLKARFADLKRQLQQYYTEPLSTGGDDVNLESEMEKLRPRVDETDIAFLQD
jgi:hypothetical protein